MRENSPGTKIPGQVTIHEHLTPIRKRELEVIGWTKARELAKVARRDRQEFESAPWVHKASKMPREEFKREVDRYLTGFVQLKELLCRVWESPLTR